MKKFDIFGSRISLKLSGNLVYRTNFGLLMTIGLIVILSIRLSTIIQRVIQGKDLTFLVQERLVDDPKKFIINNSNFAFSFGLVDEKFVSHKDYKLFKLKGSYAEQTTIKNVTTSKETLFDFVECTNGTFDSFGFKGNLIDITYLNHYCFPQHLNLSIEGTFYSQNYSDIKIFLTKCTGSDCHNETYMNSILDNHFVEISFSDTFVIPEQKHNPFMFYMRDLYWPSSQNSPKEVNIYFRNSYVESDYGWFSEEITTDIYPSFSLSDWQTVDKIRGEIFRMTLRFERQKENLYKRSYKKAIDILSELGGFSSGIMALFTIICSIYSQTELNKYLIEQTFSFAEMNDNNNKNLNLQRKSDVENKNLKQQQSQEIVGKSQLLKKDNQNKLPFSIQSSFNQLKVNTPLPTTQKNDQNLSHSMSGMKFNSSQQKREPLNINNDEQNHQVSYKENNLESQKEYKSKIFQKRKNISHETKPSNQEDVHKEINEILHSAKNIFQECQNSPIRATSTSRQFIKHLENKESSFKKLMQKTENKEVKFSLSKYVITFFCRTRKNQNEKLILDESIKLLYEYLDIQQIINKLIEIDKLKKLFLDQDQISLLEYHPKPVIGYSYNEKNQITLQQHQYDAIFINKLSPLEKTQKANQSLENIMKKKKLSKIDLKIINMIDQKFKFLFKDRLEGISNLPSPKDEEDIKYSYSELDKNEYDNVFSENHIFEKIQSINNNYNMENVIRSSRMASNIIQENKS